MRRVATDIAPLSRCGAWLLPGGVESHGKNAEDTRESDADCYARRIHRLILPMRLFAIWKQHTPLAFVGLSFRGVNILFI